MPIGPNQVPRLQISTRKEYLSIVTHRQIAINYSFLLRRVRSRLHLHPDFDCVHSVCIFGEVRKASFTKNNNFDMHNLNIELLNK